MRTQSRSANTTTQPALPAVHSAFRAARRCATTLALTVALFILGCSSAFAQLDPNCTGGVVYPAEWTGGWPYNSTGHAYPRAWENAGGDGTIVWALWCNAIPTVTVSAGAGGTGGTSDWLTIQGVT